MKSTEIWKPIIGFEGLYEASNLGRARSIDRTVIAKNGQAKVLKGKLLTVSVYKGALYAAVVISKDGKYKSTHIHGLICEAFHGRRPKGFVARHLNGNCLDNRAENLQWGTPKQNMADQYEHGTRITWRSMAHAKLNPDKVRRLRRLRERGESQPAIAAALGVSQTTVWLVLQGRAWAHVKAQ
jgi:hypothetical protein